MAEPVRGTKLIHNQVYLPRYIENKHLLIMMVLSLRAGSHFEYMEIAGT